jgi:protein ImuB
LAEAFLKFSPRVQFREPNWIFIDIASTSHLFLGEEGLMRSAMGLARDLGFGAQCAIADTPAGAQAFAVAHSQKLVAPGEEREQLKALSLPLLLELEGLQAWAKPRAIESIVSFFMMLGFNKIGELSRFTFASWQERWGEAGALLWRRLNSQDRQMISPLLPMEPLEDFVHFDFPIALTSLLLHQMQKSLDFLFARLQGRRLFAQKLTFIFHCEYSNARHTIEIAPNMPSRDRELYMTLLENRLNAINLENPVRDVEIKVMPCPEQTRQLDFFEPRTSDNDKLQSLFSLLRQSQVQPGFYKIEPSILPETGWRLCSDTPMTRDHGLKQQTEFQASPLQQLAPLREQKWRDENENIGPTAIAPDPRYGEAVARAPRPTRMLREPRAIPLDELRRLNILSISPIERLESRWWEDDTCRDYFFAVSPEGQCLWIYRDSRSEEYFLHGYFD